MPGREKGSGQFKPKMIGPKKKSTKQWPELHEQDKHQTGKHEVKFTAHDKKIHFWARNG
jgi:hypothetical protein